MAKTLKAIVCPKCGSNKKKEVKPDFYVCQSCNTEYFIDSEEIVIVYKNTDSHTFNPPNPNQTKKIAVILGIAILFFFYTIITSIFSTSNTGFIRETVKEQISITNLWDCKTTIIQSAKGELYFFSIGVLTNPDNDNEEIHAFFTDEKGKEVKKIKLNISVPKNKVSNFLDIKEMHNHDQYIIVNEKRLLKILPNQLEIEDITNEITQIKEFSSGIAQIKKEYDQSGFEILTMDGKFYVYMPLINKIIKRDEFYDYSKETPPNAILKTYFGIVEPEQRIGLDVPCKLVKYLINYQEGYPIYTPPRWAFRYNQEGVVTVRSGWQNYKHKGFLKDRIFFNLSILFYNEKTLIIKYTLDLSSETYFIQAIDIVSEEVLWTFDTEELNLDSPFRPDKAVYSPKYTLIIDYKDYLTLQSDTGKLVNFSDN